MGTKVQFEKYIPLEQGIYPAVVKDMTFEEEGNWGSFWVVTFDLGGGAVKKGSVSNKFSTKAHLYQWCRALLRRDPMDGGVDLPDDLIGKHCQLVIINEVGEDGEMRDKISQLMPAQDAPVQPAPQPAPAVPEPEMPPNPPLPL